jgi:hypothetical protein
MQDLDSEKSLAFLIDSTAEYKTRYFTSRGKKFDLDVLDDSSRYHNKDRNDEKFLRKYKEEILTPLRLKFKSDPVNISRLFVLAESELLQIRSMNAACIDYFNSLKYYKVENEPFGDQLNVAYVSACVAKNYVNVGEVKDSLFEKLLENQMNFSLVRDDFISKLNLLIGNDSQELRDIKANVLIIFEQCLSTVNYEYVDTKVQSILLTPVPYLRNHFEKLKSHFFSYLFENSANAFSANLALLNKFKVECMNSVNRTNEIFRIELYKFLLDLKLNCGGVNDLRAIHLCFMLCKNHLLLNKFIQIDRNYNIKSIDLFNLNASIPFFDTYVRVLDHSKIAQLQEKRLNLNIIKYDDDHATLDGSGEKESLYLENTVRDRLLVKFIDICSDMYLEDNLSAFRDADEDFLNKAGFKFVRVKIASTAEPQEEIFIQNDYDNLVFLLNKKLRRQVFTAKNYLNRKNEL